MKCGIYLLENIINDKLYVGQSINIEARIRSHFEVAYNKNSKEYNYPLSRAIRKYGYENFNWYIIEICSKDLLNEREIYWIDYYNSIKYGYNQVLGGNKRISLDMITRANNIKHDLKTTKLSNMAIGEKYGVSDRTVDAINNGKSWYDESEDYPIRKLKVTEKEKETKYCVDCGKILISDNAIRCDFCNKHHETTFYKYNEDYILSLLKDYNFTDTAEILGVNRMALKHYLERHNLPSNRYELKLYKESFNNK